MPNKTMPQPTQATAQATAQAPEAQPTQSAPQPTAERETITLTERTIKRVTKGEVNRYYFELDGEPFKAHNKNGEEVYSNSFSKDITTFAKEVGTKHEALNAGYAIASAIKGARLSPSFVSLCLTECKITIKRTLKLATDTREGMTAEDVYGKDTWISTIIDIKPNLTQFTLQLIIAYLQDTNKLVVNESEARKDDLNAMFASLMTQSVPANN